MWIEWNGGECPITEPSLVRLRNGGIVGARPGYNLCWEHTGKQGDIVAYSPGWHRYTGVTPEGEVEVILHNDAHQFGSERAINWHEVKYWRPAVSATVTKSAQSILRKAADLIEDRAKQRDQPNGEKSMAKTVQAFNAIYGTSLTEVQGWHFMELLKMTRSAYGVYVADDYEDKVAYAALAAEAAK